jgi:hypothetical protein
MYGPALLLPDRSLLLRLTRVSLAPRATSHATFSSACSPLNPLSRLRMHPPASNLMDQSSDTVFSRSCFLGFRPTPERGLLDLATRSLGGSNV